MDTFKTIQTAKSFYYIKFTLFIGIIISATGLWGLPPKFSQNAFNAGPVNSSGDDYAPSLTKDGKTLVFNAKRKGERYQNLYISRQKKDGVWSKPRPIRALNSAYNDETPFISPDGKLIIFSSDRDGSTEMPRNAQGQIKVSGDLYWSRRSGSSWSPPKRLPGDLHSIHHERSPFLSEDGSTLYYTMWPFGNIKRSMLVASKFDGKKFTKAQKLPAPINTGNQELGLTIAPDGQGIYFSSRRNGGYGGWDLYYSKLEKGKFSAPHNLGPEINSKKHELYFLQRAGWVYFCSNREGGYGRYDIYSNQVDNLEEMNVLVREKKTKKPIQLSLTFKAKTKAPNGKEVSGSIKKSTDKQGKTKVKVNQRLQTVEMFIEKEGYLPFFKKIELKKWRAKKEPVLAELVALKKDSSFSINDIHFDYDSARIRPESFAFLNKFAGYLASKNKLKFEIIGHTDLHGAPDYNQKLSEARAIAVKNYLTKRGLDPTRFTTSGRGKSQPVKKGVGSGFDEINRRTEFKLRN